MIKKGTSDKYMPRYPLYIISKGRYERTITADALDNLGLTYNMVVEPQEYDLYKKKIPHQRILSLPEGNHGKGSGPARNWLWEHSISEGHERHWVIDDNIFEFWRYHKNQRIRCETGSFFRAMEDFTDRFENVALSGPQYKFFVSDIIRYYPFVRNTRLMSCILIKNDISYRWRGRYNEDVDLSIRVLKDGKYATILFYSFLQGKAETQKVKGGNTEEIYGNGTFEKSKMLVKMHPDVCRLTKRYGRWHHIADMSIFKDNPLILKDEYKNVRLDRNEYGMKLVTGYGTDKQQIQEVHELKNKYEGF